MSEMVERLTKVIAESLSDTPREIAVEVLLAMREPTEQMIDACDINIPTKGEIIGVWSDMIDAALGKVDA